MPSVTEHCPGKKEEGSAEMKILPGAILPACAATLVRVAPGPTPDNDMGLKDLNSG